MKRVLSAVTILFLLTSLLLAQNPGITGSYGFFHSYEGRVLNKGHFNIYTNFNFYSTKGEYLGTPPPDFKAENWWLRAANLAFSVGIIKHLDVTAALRLYQDTHYPNDYNLPDDIFLTIKAGSFNFVGRRFSGALQGTIRIPTGEVHNYSHVEYASGALEFGFLGAMSYFADPYFPDRDFNLHYNVGLWFHNEKGQDITIPDQDPRKASVSSSKLIMALAAEQPLGLFDLRLELFGHIYLAKPDPFIYSAEDLAAITPGIRYKPLDWLSLDLGIDLRLSPGDRQRTSGVPNASDTLDIPISYPPWKVHAGLVFYILPAGKSKSYQLDIANPEARKRLEYYEMIMKESEKAKKVEKRVQKLRKERESVTKEIDKIKEEIEGG